MPKTLSIVGAGRVGRALGRGLHELGWKIGVVSARTEASARQGVRKIGAGEPAVGITPAVLGSRTILLTVPDDAIVLVADELAHIGGEQLQGKVVLHASGALDAGVLAAVRNCGASVGSMHPLQTFSGTNRPALEGKIFAVQGDEKAVQSLEVLRERWEEFLTTSRARRRRCTMPRVRSQRDTCWRWKRQAFGC